MELNQLLSAVENVLNALEVSGVQTAVQSYKGGIDGGGKCAADDGLAHASDRYMDYAAAYGPSESTLVDKLHLTSLQSPTFWFDLTAPGVDESVHLPALAELQTNLEFAVQHLPKLLALSETHCVVGSDQTDSNKAVIKVRIHDAVEKASFPDRISRLIDGVDLVYQGCAELAGESPDELEVLSVTGLHYRAVVFRGHPEVATATRRVIRALYQEASNSLEEENYSVDQIAEQIPFMHALDELFRVNALDAERANDIREGVLAGSIMLLECGVRMHGDENVVTSNTAKVRAAPQQGDRSGSNSATDNSPSSLVDIANDDELEYLTLDLNRKHKTATAKKK